MTTVKLGRKWAKSFWNNIEVNSLYIDRNELKYLYSLGLQGKAAAKLLNEKFKLSENFSEFVNRSNTPSRVAHVYYKPRNLTSDVAVFLSKCQKMSESSARIEHYKEMCLKYFGQ